MKPSLGASVSPNLACNLQESFVLTPLLLLRAKYGHIWTEQPMHPMATAPSADLDALTTAHNPWEVAQAQSWLAGAAWVNGILNGRLLGKARLPLAQTVPTQASRVQTLNTPAEKSVPHTPPIKVYFLIIILNYVHYQVTEMIKIYKNWFFCTPVVNLAHIFLIFFQRENNSHLQRRRTAVWRELGIQSPPFSSWLCH